MLVLESNYFSTEDVLANGKIDYLYHMSHINNLAGILKRGLYCHNYSHEHSLVKKHCRF
jgi:hypothetical protein